MHFFKITIISLSLPIFILGMNSKYPYKPIIIKPQHNASSQLKRYSQPAPCSIATSKVIEKHYQSDSIFSSIIQESLQDCGIDAREKNNLSNLDNQMNKICEDPKHCPVTYGKTLSQLYVGNDTTVLKQMLAHTIIDVVATKSTVNKLEQEVHKLNQTNKLMAHEIISMQKKSDHYQNLTIIGCLTLGYLLSTQNNNSKN